MVSRLRTQSTPAETRVQPRYQNIDYLKSTLFFPAETIESVTNSTVTVSIPGITETFHDHVTPDFWKKVAQGIIINNPMSKISTYTDKPAVFASQTVRTYRNMTDSVTGANDYYHLHTTDRKGGEFTIDQLAVGRTGFLPVPLESETKGVDSLKDLAITSAWANMSNSDILLGTCIAEAGKTVSGLLSCSRKVLKVAKVLRKPTLALKRFNSKSIKQHIRDYEDARMEVRYGLRPLYYDILGVMKLTTEPRGIRSTARGEASDSATVSDSVQCTASVFTNTTIRVDRESTRTLNVKAGVLCEGREQTLWQRTGISLISETAWELTPFSFIADWFGNYGDYISSWSPKPGVKYLASWVVVEDTMTQTVRLHDVSHYSYEKTGTFSRGSISRVETDCSLYAYSKQESITKVRTPVATRPVLPTISVNLNPQKLLDLATIGKQIYRAFRR